MNFFLAFLLLWSGASIAQTISPAGGGGASLAGNTFTGTQTAPAFVAGTQNSVAGSVTIAGPASGNTGGTLSIGNTGGTSAKTAVLGNGSWWTTAVPYFRPSDVGGNGVLDVFPNGATAAAQVDAWIDICSMDVTVNTSNWECLNLRKTGTTTTYASIDTQASGTGTANRPLVLQRGGGNLVFGDANTGTVSQFYFNRTVPTGLVLANANLNTGVAAYSTLEAWNANTTTGYIRLIALGTGWTTNGAFLQNAGGIEAGTSMVAMNIMTRGAAAPVNFYIGGFASGNLVQTIATTGVTITGSLNVTAGYSSNGTAGITQTCTVNQAKTLVFSNGLLTSGSCNT